MQKIPLFVHENRSKHILRWRIAHEFFSCFDLVNGTTTIEYVKLILSSQNYTIKNGMPRVLLETALTATNELTRKWSTRFLEVLLVFDVIDDFGDFGVRLLLQQCADPSAKVVRHAVRILTRWLPVCKFLREKAKRRSQVALQFEVGANCETIGEK